MQLNRQAHSARTGNLLLFAVAVANPSLLWAQRGPAPIGPAPATSALHAPDDPNWNPSAIPADMTGWMPTGIGKSYGFSESKAKAGIALLNQIDPMMRGLPALNPPPAGIFLRVREYVRESMSPPGLLAVSYAVDFIKPFRMSNNKFGLNDAAGGYGILINHSERPFPGPDSAVTEIRRVGEFRGYPVYEAPWGSFLLMTKRTGLPWEPITVREYAARQLKGLEKGAPLPSAEEKYKKNYQLDHEKFMKKLASISPAELDAPVYLANESHGWSLDGLSTSNDKNAFRLVRVNKNFIDSHLPPTAVQFITILFRLNYSHTGCMFMKLESDLHNQVDFKLLEGLLQ
jgi:hypothetical protein